jgi:hypothetical protein
MRHRLCPSLPPLPTAGMPPAVTVLQLGALEAQVRDHAAPPTALVVRERFESAVGPCEFELTRELSICGDYYIGGWIFWTGKVQAAPANAWCAFEVAAVKDGAAAEALGLAGRQNICNAWRTNEGIGETRLVMWSTLRRAVVDEGRRLQLAVIALPDAGPLPLGSASGSAGCGPSTRSKDASAHGGGSCSGVSGGDAGTLHVPGGDPQTCSLAGGAAGLLDSGAFADATLRAGGREWRVHRAMLAAASPALRSMLESDMAEGREAAVELRDADPEAVDLLLRHIYSGAIDVPLRAALPLYGLADQYQLASGLAQALRVWLAAVALSPAALAALLPVAWHICERVFFVSMYRQAASAEEALSAEPGFGAWPLDLLLLLLPACSPVAGFKAAAAWAAAPGEARKRQRHWPQLAYALAWFRAKACDLQAIQEHPAAQGVPELRERLLAVSIELLAKAEAK